MARIGILDDEVIICETLTRYLKDLGHEPLDYALSFEEALTLVQTHAPDIMLLDINLRGIQSGIDFAHYLRKHHDLPIVFISSYSDKHTIENVKDVQANGFLIKPFTREDLFATIEVAMSNFVQHANPVENTVISPQNDYIFIKQDALFVRINLEDILYCKSDGVYIEIITENGKYLLRETLKNLVKLLPESQFTQIHRSYLVRLDRIDAISYDFVVIKDQPLPLSRALRDAFMARINLK